MTDKEIAEKSYERLKKEYIPEIQGEIILYVLAYLRCECGYGAKRIKDFIHGFNAFADVMRMDGTHSTQIVQMLREECGVDIQEEYRLLWEAKGASKKGGRMKTKRTQEMEKALYDYCGAGGVGVYGCFEVSLGGGI